MQPFDARKLLWSQIRNKKNSSQRAQRTHMDFLRKIPIFQELSRWQVKRISELLYSRTYEPGEYLFQVDQPGAALFLIHSGKVSVEVDDGQGTLSVLAELEAGSFIGELALLDQSPRSASAKAVVPTQTFALLRSDLEKLVEKEPEITTLVYKAVAQVIGDRLKATNEMVKKEQAAA